MAYRLILLKATSSTLNRKVAKALAIARGLALSLVAFFAVVAPSQAQPTKLRAEHVDVELIADISSVAPGDKFWIGLRLNHDPQWHTYWKNPGDSGLPTQAELSLPGDVTVGPIMWPKPHRIFIPPLANYGYEGELVLAREVQVPKGYAGGPLKIAMKAAWLICKEVCIPGEAELGLVLPVKAGPRQASPQAALIQANLARVPKNPLKVLIQARDDTLSLLLPSEIKQAQKIEYFAGMEETFVHSAEQKLFLGEDGRFRVDLKTVTDKKLDFQTEPQRASGVLEIDGLAYVVRPTYAQGEGARSPPPGQLIATLDGVSALKPSGTSAAERLLQAASGESTAKSVASPALSTNPDRSSDRSPDRSAEAPASSSTLISFGAALLGGLILNLMPCVFPVIGLKLMSFAGQGSTGYLLSAEAKSRLRRDTLAFATGVVLSFALLGALMLTLRSAGEAVGWGFQLQSPWFVGAMFLLFIALGLNFAGLYEMGLNLTRLGNLEVGSEAAGHSGGTSAAESSRVESSRASSTGGALFSGVLAVLVATPCTAPFMGSALGYSLAQPGYEAILVFLALGVGMAAPYLLLALFPAWLKFLPKPGRWMETFKQFLSFPMFAAAVWLLWVFTLQTSVDGLLSLGLGGVALALGLWAWGRLIQRAFSRGSETRFGGVHIASMALILAAGGAVFAALKQAIAEPSPGMVLGGAAENTKAGGSTASIEMLATWQPWSKAAVSQVLTQNHPVFVDFTAAWCVSCQANKKLVLESETVRQAFEKHGVRSFRADWTRRDPLITAELAALGRSGVPVYLLYLPGKEQPKILPELLTSSMILSALSDKER